MKQEALIDLGKRVVAQATQAGVDAAEAVVRESEHLSVKVRLGSTELVEQAGSQSIGLRVFREHRSASSVTSDLTSAGLDFLVESAVTLSRLNEKDPYSEPSKAKVAPSNATLDLFDSRVGEINVEEALDRAQRAEAAALQVDSQVAKSEGATFTRVRSASALILSTGFEGTHAGTYASLSVAPVATGADGVNQRASAWTASRHLSNLRAAEAVGQEAGQKALAKLGARKVSSRECPVVFAPDAGRALISAFLGCALGSAVWRRSTYLADREGTRVASDLITLVDDPLLTQGMGSRPFDGEGMTSQKNVVVERGVLKTFLLDSYSARKLGRVSTASASRSGGGGVFPSSSNCVMKKGAMTCDELIASTASGLYVNDLMGFGFNAVTGDFSRGAAGYLIENGKLSHPVAEVTISLNFDDLWQRVDAVANDLDQRSSVVVPTFRVSSMTVAGS